MITVIVYNADSTLYERIKNVIHIHLSGVNIDGTRQLQVSHVLHEIQEEPVTTNITLQKGMFIGIW